MTEEQLLEVIKGKRQRIENACPELYTLVKLKRAEGSSAIPEMLELCKEKRMDNIMMARAGKKSPSGLDGLEPPPMASNLIAFFLERDAIFIGEDATKAADAINRYAAELNGLAPGDLDTRGSERMIIARVAKGRVRVEEREGIPYLQLWSSHFNDWLLAIYRAGHGLDAFQLE